ncbi:MAG: competence protein CoiA [Burkholderiales bacterium]
MLYAIQGDVKVLPTPNQRGICPQCGSPVISKCGVQKSWHWAHETLTDCDSFSEGETEWHYRWKSFFNPSMVEVKIGPHRADIKVRSTVIELQHSPISASDIHERESFYDDMIWIVDGSTFEGQFNFIRRINTRASTNVPLYTFCWTHARSCWLDYATRPVFFHFPSLDGLFLLRTAHSPRRGTHGSVADISVDTVLEMTVKGQWKNLVSYTTPRGDRSLSEVASLIS